MTNRDIKFGQLLAIARIMGERVFEKGKPSISEINWNKFSQKPFDVFTKIHNELMEYAHQFGEDELILMDLFGEILAGMDESEFTNEPLDRTYLLGYYQQGNDLNNMIGVKEASEILKLAEGTVKNYCAEGKIVSKKIGNTWVIDKTELK